MTNLEIYERKLKKLGYETNKLLDLTDGDSNTVIAIDNRYLYKDFTLTDKLQQEVSGMYLQHLISGADIPLIIEQGDGFYVAEYLAEATSAYKLLNSGAISSAQVSVFVASFIARAYWGYRKFDQTKIGLFPRLVWSTRLTETISAIAASALQLQQCGFTDTAKLLRTLRQLQSQRLQLTLTHRDLHLENLLLAKSNEFSRFYVIDFEHSLQAPVELELQNSIFWQDDKSLNFGEIIFILKNNYSVPFNEDLLQPMYDFYFADQLNIALQRRDVMKIDLLIEKYYTNLPKISKSSRIRSPFLLTNWIDTSYE